ncbi:putative ubiquitin-conjugating enzyme E2 23 [Turnera subulata]|uniref:E2 ubiquitin-conjugating enzyme n=1 Tax=Turnera subulata TaxID=218843 RepID=A0A9Q0JAP3_9ROSI|nr:putative ubiquitin-conjugating enzyme E2 23 [Turnera subulata]
MGSAETDIARKVDDEPVVNAGDGENGQDVGVRNSHHVPYLYRQDIVRHAKSGVIGVVSEIPGDSDSDSSITDDEDDSDDEEVEDVENAGGDGEGEGEGDVNGDMKKGDGNCKSEVLKDDQVRVLWTDDTEQIQSINDISVVDRGFLHGDYVASGSDPTGQLGVILDVDISVDLLAPDGSILRDISSKDLIRVREFAVGDYVVLGPWLGRVDDVLDNVTVLLDDGSSCRVAGAEPLRLKPISKSIFDEDEQFPYYPGQRVKATSSSVFFNSKWLSGSWRASRLEGTVTKVTAGSVFVYWIASAGYGPDSSTSPAEEQNPNSLKLLSCFEHANWQVGDWCLLPPSVAQSSSRTIDKGLSKLKIHDSLKTALDPRQPDRRRESVDIPVEELDENKESMDVSSSVAPDGSIGAKSHESSSCGSSKSFSKEPVHQTWPLHRKKIRKVLFKKEKKPRKKEEFERALLIVNTRTRVDVAWQDGTVEHGLRSTALVPIDSPGDHEFVSEQYVVEKASDDFENASEARRVGVVKSVSAKERTACVRWLKPVARAEDPREFGKEETVSVYELESHPDYDYSYGDVVVRLSPVSAPVQISSDGESVAETKQHSGSSGIGNEKKRSVCKAGENEISMEFPDLSWVGHITGLRNGDIEVTWADGMVSTVGPQAIFVVGRDDDDDSIAAGSEVSDDAASWETVNDDEMDALDNAQEDVELQNAADLNSEADDEESNTSGRNPALSLPFAALDFVTRLATGIFSRARKNVDADFSDSKYENELQASGMKSVPEKSCSSSESSSQKHNLIKTSSGQSTTYDEMEGCTVEQSPVSSNAVDALPDLRTEESDMPSSIEDDIWSFKRFDIAKDPVDHHFLGSDGKINHGRKWFKKVQQDWNILQNNLPDGIYVRVYEDRMDLLRAVIVGAYGTPYQDGLFFFDFHLPPEYPDVPPSAYYHSGGWRINPNLYEEGKVCLSLLNTWTGRGNEVWSPSSSILQVLVSLQGLVLNSKPYFNEAGYDKQIGTAEGEKNSLSYNENTFLLNCKTMMYLMRRPPKDFEELVKEHFRRRGHYVLKACDAYMQGNLIGSLSEDASVSSEYNCNSTSVGFKLMLAKIVPKLYSALDGVGADCHQFKHLIQS